MTPEESIQVTKDLAELEYWRRVMQGAMDHLHPVDMLSHRDRVSEIRFRAGKAAEARMASARPVDATVTKA